MYVDIKLSDVTLETQRLTLRGWEEDDLDVLYENASRPEITELAGWKHHNNIEESKLVLDRFINEKNALAIEYKGNGKIIGNIVFESCFGELDESFACLNGVNIRYAMNEKYWGQSLMYEAMKSVINYCFHELELDFISSGYFVENDMQRSFLYKLDFKDYKRVKYHTNFGIDKMIELTLLYNPMPKNENMLQVLVKCL